MQQFKNKKCETCSFRTYPEKKGPASEYKCFDCQKRDIFVVHKDQTSQVESNSKLSDENVTESKTSSSSSESADTTSDLRCEKKFSKHVTKIRRVRQKAVRKISTKPRHHVDAEVSENVVPAFADTDADIIVMSLTTAKQISLPLYKTKVRTQPYGSKPLKCVRYFDGTIMYGSTVANTQIYIIKQPVLSVKPSEELQILKSHPQPLLDTQPLVAPITPQSLR